MLQESDFATFVQDEALRKGLNGQEVHRALYPAYRRLAGFMERLRPDMVEACASGVNLASKDPYVYADWKDPDTGVVLSLQFHSGRAKIVVYAEGYDKTLSVRKYTMKLGQYLLCLVQPMPSEYIQ